MGYRDLSLWLDTCGDDLTPRPALAGDAEADVAIVGAGYTGLWTAYYLASAEPSLRIAVLDQHVAGFGASGRNGGWCSALFAASWPAVARRGGRSAVLATHQAMVDTVHEVGRVAARLPLDSAFHRGGTLSLATTQAQVRRLRAGLAADREWGLPPDSEWLDAQRARSAVAAAGVLGAVYTPHCARVQPAALVRGLARAVEGLGVRLYEGTRALRIQPGSPAQVHTAGGRLRAPIVVRATEGYTCTLAGQRRTLLPVYSLMIATEPLPPVFWAEVGWDGAQTLTDGRHLLIYAQRTADGRIAFGGRGAPYHPASAVRPAYDRDERVFTALEHALHELLPATRQARITHRWGGPLGVPRDWFPSVVLDRRAGLAWAGGYVGDGVATANLAGRTLTDLILARDTELTRLPWVGHRSPRWEVEPLRWIGVNLGRRLAASVDAAEARGGSATRRAALLDRLTGS